MIGGKRKMYTKPKFIPKKGVDYICIDGSTFGNSRKNPHAKGGIGVFFGINDHRNISEPFYMKPVTNNRCELYAAIRAIQTYASSKFGTDKPAPKSKMTLNLYGDSKYVIDSVTKWIKKWKYNKWKTSTGTDVKNKELIVCLDKLLETYGKKIKINFLHTKAHRTGKDIPKNISSEEYYIWYGNMMADKFATDGSRMSIGGKKDCGCDNNGKKMMDLLKKIGSGSESKDKSSLTVSFGGDKGQTKVVKKSKIVRKRITDYL